MATYCPSKMTKYTKYKSPGGLTIRMGQPVVDTVSEGHRLNKDVGKILFLYIALLLQHTVVFLFAFQIITTLFIPSALSLHH